MSTTDIPTPSEVQPPTPPPKRHRARNILLSIIGAFVALVVIIVIIAVASSNSATPTAAPNTAPPAAAPATPAPSTPAPSTPSVSQFGTGNGFTYTDGTLVAVTSATPATLSQSAAGGNPGDPAVLISVRVTAGSASISASQIQVSATGGPDGTQLSSVFDSNTNLANGTLAPGEHGTYAFEFDLVHASNGSHLDVTVTPGYSYNASSFTGAVSGS